MAKTTDLTEVVTLADGDLGNAVDVSNTSMDATGTNSKFTMANLWAYIKTKADVVYQAAGSYLTASNISDTAYGVGWNGDTTNAPSKNAVYDQMETRVPTGAVTTSGLTQATARLLGRTTAGTGAIEELSSADSFVSASSDTVAGKVELAIASEVNTGTDATRAISPDALAGSNFGIRYVQCALNGTTALTTSEKCYFRIPAGLTGMNLVSVTGSVGTGATGASSSGTPTFTVKNVTDNNQMLSTSLTIDANEYTSATAATPVVIDGTKDDVVTDDLIEVAVTTAGTGVTYATVTLGFQLP